MNNHAIFKPKGDNPFTPGAGKTPPFLAGREDEQRELGGYVKRLVNGGRGEIVVMQAPRGNGKTVLLNWLKRQCRERGAHVISTVPDEDGSLSADALRALIKGKGGDAADSTERVFGINLRFLQFGRAQKFTRQPQGIKEQIKRAAQKRPLVLLIDEAYRWTGKNRPAHLGVFQDIIDDCPVLLVIAGTPGMLPTIRKGATFLNRVPTLCPGLLAGQAAADAIKVPLDEGGVDIAADALVGIIDNAQRYPFFLQLWGKALWDYADKHGTQTLTEAHAQAVKPDINATRDNYYRDRLKELITDDELRVAATAIADAYRAAEPYDKDGVIETIDIALTSEIGKSKARHKKATTLAEQLVGLGYIWEPAKSPFVHAGIPSLMTYIAQRRLKRQPPLPDADARRISEESRERQGA